MREAVVAVAILLASCGGNGAKPPEDAPAGVDAAPPIDAVPTDARRIDAPPGDAPTADAPPASFHASVASVDFGTVPVGGPEPALVVIEVDLDAALPVQVDVTATGPFLITRSTCQGPLTGRCLFSPVLVTPGAFGPVSGTVELVAGATHVTIPITATLAGYVVGTAGGWGHGHVTASPVGIGCPGCYAPGTVVTLTAAADGDSTFTGWSDPACSGDTCVYTAELVPHAPVATFTGPVVPFQIDFIGNAPGDVVVSPDAPGDAVSCSASCTVAVPLGASLRVEAATPANFVGYGAPCSGIRNCDVPAGTASLTLDFELSPGEVDLMLPGSSQYVSHSVEFDPAGELLIAGDDVRVLTTSYATKWTAPFVGPAHFAANGDVVVVAAGAVTKLAAADGAVLWSQPTGGLESYVDTGQTAHGFAVTPSGAVVLSHASTMVDLWDPTGTTLTELATDSQSSCIGTGPDDAIYVGVVSTVYEGFLNYEAFDATGARQLPDFPPSESWYGCSSLGVSTNYLFTAFWDPEANSPDIGFYRFGIERSAPVGSYFDFGKDVRDSAITLQNLVAANSSDSVVFASAQDPNVSECNGLSLTKYDATLALTWSLSRPGIYPYADTDPRYGINSLYDLALAADGRIAVSASYFGAASGHTVVEIFPP